MCVPWNLIELLAINEILTGEVRMFVEVVPPFLVDSHLLHRSSLALCRESLGLSVLNHLPDMLRMHRVKDCEEVVPVW